MQGALILLPPILFCYDNENIIINFVRTGRIMQGVLTLLPPPI